jgi:hypothetical protein
MARVYYFHGHYGIQIFNSSLLAIVSLKIHYLYIHSELAAFSIILKGFHRDQIIIHIICWCKFPTPKNRQMKTPYMLN